MMCRQIKRVQMRKESWNVEEYGGGLNDPGDKSDQRLDRRMRSIARELCLIDQIS